MNGTLYHGGIEIILWAYISHQESDWIVELQGYINLDAYIGLLSQYLVSQRFRD